MGEDRPRAADKVVTGTTRTNTGPNPLSDSAFPLRFTFDSRNLT